MERQQLLGRRARLSTVPMSAAGANGYRLVADMSVHGGVAVMDH
jgi:hypothetical protein